MSGKLRLPPTPAQVEKWKKDLAECRKQLAEARRENEQFRAGRVTCACGKDTADIKYAQCYSCRQELPRDNEHLLNECHSLRAELERRKVHFESGLASLCGKGFFDDVEATEEP